LQAIKRDVFFGKVDDAPVTCFLKHKCTVAARNDGTTDSHDPGSITLRSSNQMIQMSTVIG